MTASALRQQTADRIAAELGHSFEGEIRVGGHYASAVRDGHTLYISGQVPRVGTTVMVTGRAGDTVSLEQAREGARICALRALWPRPLVCRWNLHRRHGRYGYEDAEKLYGPFDKIVDPDPETRQALARVIAGTVKAGQNAFVTVSNNAEGCAPRTVATLAQEVADLLLR